MAHRKFNGSREARSLLEAAGWYLDVHHVDPQPTDEAVWFKSRHVDQAELQAIHRMFRRAGLEAPHEIRVEFARMPEECDESGAVTYPERDTAAVYMRYRGLDVCYKSLYYSHYDGYVVRKSVDAAEHGEFGTEIEADLKRFDAANASGVSRNAILDVLPEYAEWYDAGSSHVSFREACIVIGVIAVSSQRAAERSTA